MNRYFLLLCTIVILCHGFGEGGLLTDLEKGLSNIDPLGDLKTQIENLEKNLSSLWSMVSDMNKNVKHDLHQLHLFQMEVNDKLKNFLGMPLKNEGKDMHHMNKDGLKHSDAEHSDHPKSYHGSFHDHHHDDHHHGGHHDDHHHGGHHDDHHHDHHGGHYDDHHHDHHGYHGPHHYGSDVHSREDHHDSHEDHHDDSHHHNDSSHEHDDSHKGHDDHSDHHHGHDDHSDHHQGHDDHSDHHQGHDDHSDHHQGHDDHSDHHQGHDDHSDHHQGHDDHNDHSSHDNSHHHHSDHHNTTTQTSHSHSDDHSQHKDVHNVSHDDHHHHHESHHDYHHHHHHDESHHSQNLNFDFAICNVTSNRAIPEEKQQNVTGLIRLWQKENGTLHVHIQLEGFKIHQHDSGDHKSDKHSHGFHVHRDGDLSNGCQSTGPHYNPLEVAHGGPKSPVRHVGDLGNIACDEHGVTNIVVTDEIASLQGPYSIIGKSLVVHEDVDDFGTNPDIPASVSSGNAGSRIACCIIEKVERLPPPIRKDKTSHYHHHHSSHH